MFVIRVLLLSLLLSNLSVANAREIQIQNHSSTAIIILNENGKEMRMLPHAKSAYQLSNESNLKALSAADKHLLCVWSLLANPRYPIVKLNYGINEKGASYCGAIILK